MFLCCYQVKDWRKLSLEHPEQILWLQYENLKNNGKFELNRIASFLGYSDTGELKSSEQIESNVSLLDAVWERGSFDQMKEQARAQGGDCISYTVLKHL